MRWPWQTREDALLRLVDRVLEDAKQSRAAAARDTENAKTEAFRQFKGEGDERRK